MRRFWCDCGHPLFFESTQCAHCSMDVGFDTVTFDMISLHGVRSGSLFLAVGDYVYCRNGIEHQACNWVIPAEFKGNLCAACCFNRTIPNLSRPNNLTRWRRFEAAKKRLIYTLYDLRLPLIDRWQEPERGLLFDFKEDKRSNPVLLESFVGTGYLSGVITINAMEADDVAREQTRLQMNESYRTLLGHLRHESGHYYQPFFKKNASLSQEFRRLFGDPAQNYKMALDRHYRRGPVDNWQDCYISSYASCHPVEDWAECWSHYLHIHDTLETAAAHKMLDGRMLKGDFRSVANLWRGFAVTLNELNRSIGLADAYPFVINDWVESKLAFVAQVITELRDSPQALAAR